MQVNEFKQKA